MARAVAVLGTGSDVGKSLVAAGLCRILHRAGVRVAPFKSQNMSLNSFVTAEGGEMGRAQVLQAQACGLLPHVDMNPILLKPEADQRSQVIVQGKIWGTQDANGYFGCRPELFGFVQDSYERLAKDYQVIVIEGAGSAAEVNLRDRDLVNWPVVELANAVVVLVADIDRGGVFAQVIGTLDLIDPKERQRVLGIVVNKFRGDLNLFTDGVAFLEERTGLPVLGVLPFLRDLQLDQEDSVGVDRSSQAPFGDRTVNVAVVLLPHMSNFTDFNALAAEEDVVLRYAATPAELSRADVVILPGSKTTIADLAYLKSAGFSERLAEYVDQGGELVGICGGFQMLGYEISDPLGVEMGGLVKGLGLLEVNTVLLRDKKTVQVVATPAHLGSAVGLRVRGYEIHMGETRRLKGKACFKILQTFGQERLEEDREDGAWREDKLVWGTYIHGVFDQPAFRRAWLNRVRVRKGLPQIDPTVSEAVTARLCSALDRWADHVEKHVDLSRVFDVLRIA